MLERRRWLIIFLAFVATLAIYYLSIPLTGAHFSKICHKADYGPLDKCAYWDTVTACILRILYFLDDHNGALSAIAGVMVAVFTAVLSNTTKKLWMEGAEQRKLFSRQLKMQEREYIAAHRPLLVIRDLEPLWPTEGHHFHCEFVIANKGEGVCWITAYEFALDKYVNGVKWPSSQRDDRYDEISIDIVGRNLTSGQRIPHKVFSNITRNEHRAEIQLAQETPMRGRRPYTESFNIILTGFIEYTDNIILRRTAIYRKYEFVTDRFGPGDPERDYAD